MVDWLSLLVPIAYLGVLIGSLATFSSLYRKRKAAKSLSLTPYFPPHIPRSIYLSLLHLEPSASTGNKPIPDSVLKAALLRRATEDISRLIEVRNAEQALQQLLQRGSVGDEVWERFLRGKAEVEAGCRDVVQEANAFSSNWGQTIFKSANEMANNLMLRKKVDAIQAQVDSERAWWEKRKATIQESFIKELDEEKRGSVSGAATGSVVAGVVEKEKGSDGSDDGVLVERDAVLGKSGGGGGGKKKKGKK